MKTHNYLKKIEEMRANGQLPFEGAPGCAPGCTSVDVSHDAWCMVFSGGTCNCDPKITVRATQPNRAARRAARK